MDEMLSRLIGPGYQGCVGGAGANGSGFGVERRHVSVGAS